MATEKLTNERLTKKERNKLWNRYMWFNNGCTNFQNFYGNGWAWVLRPLFEKYYNKDGVIEEMGTPSEVIENPKSERTKTFLSRFSGND